MLRRLKINHGLVDSLILSALASSAFDNGHMLVPRLTCLHLGACHDFDASDVVDMILNRYEAAQEHSEVSFLQHIELLYCNGMFDDDSNSALSSVKAILGDATDGLKLTVENRDSFPEPFGVGIFPFVRLAESHHAFLEDECNCSQRGLISFEPSS
jgi:hypothetical protein